jgi:hypothetical protein
VNVTLPAVKNKTDRCTSFLFFGMCGMFGVLKAKNNNR